MVGEASYEQLLHDRAEIAIAIADDYQGHGLGTHLLGLLAGIADAAGIVTFEAEVLPENGPMLEVFRESGLPVRIRSEPGVVRVEISTSLTPDAQDRFEHREELAAAAAVRALLCPSSIAVVGASRQPALREIWRFGSAGPGGRCRLGVRDPRNSERPGGTYAICR